MEHDEQREPAERLTALRHEDRVAPDDALFDYAKKAFEEVPVAEDDHPQSLGWRDPRAARFRRAVAAEANKKGRAKARAREAEAKVQALTQELESAYELIEQAGATNRALEEKCRELYVSHHMLLARQDESADLTSSEESADPA